MSKESETYRLQMLRHLQEKYGKAKPAVVLEAEQVIAEFREQEARDGEAIARLRSPLPDPYACPQCHYLHGRLSTLTPIGSKDTDIDRFTCKTCGFTQARRA